MQSFGLSWWEEVEERARGGDEGHLRSPGLARAPLQWEGLELAGVPAESELGIPFPVFLFLPSPGHINSSEFGQCW